MLFKKLEQVRPKIAQPCEREFVFGLLQKPRAHRFIARLREETLRTKFEKIGTLRKFTEKEPIEI